MGATTSWTKVEDQADEMICPNVYRKVYTFTGSASYATGGETFDAATDIALDSGDSILAAFFKDDTMTYDCVYDGSNDKILFFDGNTITQEGSTDDTTGTTITGVFICQKA